MNLLDNLYVVEIWVEKHEIQIRQYITQYEIKPYFIKKTGFYEIDKLGIITEVKEVNYDFHNKRYLYCSTLEELIYIFINGIYIGVSAESCNSCILRTLN